MFNCFSSSRLRFALSRLQFAVWTAALALLAGLSSGVLAAQSAADSSAQFHRVPQVTQSVDPDRVVPLVGAHPILPAQALDIGPAAPSDSAPRMLLLLRRNAQDEQTLETLLQSQQNPASPSFHRWLTPAEFAARFGVVNSDLAAVTAWLQSQGFAVEGLRAGGNIVEFSGSIAQLQSAFHLAVHRVSLQGEVRLAAVNDPQIPAALAPVVTGLVSFGGFPPRAAVRRGPSAIFHPDSRRFQPDSTATHLHPQDTTTTTTGSFLYVGPADAATLYDLPNHALNTGYTGATLDGTGTTIAIAADSNIDPTQVANYRSLFGLAANAPTVVLDGATDPGITSDAVESYLDTEVAGGLAPGARILLYTAADTNTDFGLNLALVRAVDDNLADVLTVSYSACEATLGAAGNAFYNTLWEQAVAQGISVVVASGDAGSAGCDDPAQETSASAGLAVNGLASTPYNLAVGGTDFAALAGPDGGGANFGNYVNSTNANGTLLSVQGYIPEVPWNESSTSYPPTTLAQNIALPAPYASMAASGGGASSCAQSTMSATGASVCASGYAKPSWQSAPGVPSDGVRDLPDLALFASTGFDYAAWGICTDQDTDALGNPVIDCQPNSSGQFHVMSAGGTSAAAAATAAILALVRESTGQRQGQAASVLYNLARTTPAVFHDVTTGNNAVACVAATPQCQLNALGFDYLTGFNAAAGWDAATGLGSVDAAALITAWAAAPLTATTTQLAVMPATVEHGQLVSVTATVTGSSGTPTGQVALHADNANPVFTPEGVAVGVYPLVANGSTGTLTLNNLPGGTYPLVASYGGAATLAGSVSQPVTVTVAPESSSTLVTWAVTDPATGAITRNAAIPYGSLVQFLAEPYGNRSTTVNGVLQPDGAATGTVVFTLGANLLSTQPLGIAGTAATTPVILPSGAATLTAAYSGDASFNASAGTVGVTVAPGATTLALSSSTTTYSGSPVTFSVALSTDSLGVAPTGTVTLSNGTATLATAQLNGVAATSSALASGTASFTISNPPPGTNTLTASYSGDANYGGSTSAGLVFHGVANFSLTAAPVSLNSIHATASDTLTLTSLNGYAGTVKLSCALAGSTSAANPPQCGLDPATETLAANGTAQPLLLIFGAGTKLPSGVTAGGVATPLLALLGCVLLWLVSARKGLVPARKAQWRSLAVLLLLAACVLPFAACGGQSSLITAGSYNFTVTATDAQNAAITTSVTVAVTVQ